jgi:hypothetical protein
MVRCSSRETASLKILKKLAGPPDNYGGSNEPSLAPQFKWLEYTFKIFVEFFLVSDELYVFTWKVTPHLWDTS